jgi:hypothetical protein
MNTFIGTMHRYSTGSASTSLQDQTTKEMDQLLKEHEKACSNTFHLRGTPTGITLFLQPEKNEPRKRELVSFQDVDSF